MSFQTQDTPLPDTQTVATNQRHNGPKQSLETLSRWRRKWVNAQMRGLRRRIGESVADFNVRSVEFQQRCINAIEEIDRAVAVRQSKPHRCALPKKQQRALGLLPQVIHGVS